MNESFMQRVFDDFIYEIFNNGLEIKDCEDLASFALNELFDVIEVEI